MKGFSSKRIALKTDVVGPETDVVGPETDVVGPETGVVGPETDVVGPETDVVGPETRCLQELPCTIQPGNVTGWGSEGVKMALIAAQSCEPVWPSGKALGW